MHKGVSPAMSYVLLLAIVVILSISAYVWGNYEISRLEDLPIAYNAEAQMIGIDQLIQSVAHGDINFTTVMDLYYPKGVMQVDEDNDTIKYTVQLNGKIYEAVTGTATSCCPNCTIIQDENTGVKMVRIYYTNVFRGSTGDELAQLVEITACYDDIDIQADAVCIGKSGPRAQLTARKLGYNPSNNKPIVRVRIC